MQKKFEKGSEDWQMLADFNRLQSDFWIPEDSDEYWDNLIVRACEIAEKYKNYDYTYVSLMFDSFLEMQQIKLKANRLNIGNRFTHLKKIYEVIENHGVKFIGNEEY